MEMWLAFKDELLNYDEWESQHVVVLYKGSIYQFSLYHDSGTMYYR